MTLSLLLLLLSPSLSLDASVTAMNELYDNIFHSFTPTHVDGHYIDPKIHHSDSVLLQHQHHSDSDNHNNNCVSIPHGAVYYISGTGALVKDDCARQGGFPDWIVKCSCGVVDGNYNDNDYDYDKNL